MKILSRFGEYSFFAFLIGVFFHYSKFKNVGVDIYFFILAAIFSFLYVWNEWRIFVDSKNKNSSGLLLGVAIPILIFMSSLFFSIF